MPKTESRSTATESEGLMIHRFSLKTFTQLMDDDGGVRKREGTETEKQRQGSGKRGAPSVAHAFLNKF